MYSVTRELLAFVVSTRKWWMLPAIALLFLISWLAIVTQGSVLAPLIYTIF